MSIKNAIKRGGKRRDKNLRLWEKKNQEAGEPPKYSGKYCTLFKSEDKSNHNDAPKNNNIKTPKLG